MSALRELQAAFRDALLGGEIGPALGTIAADGLSAAARLAIYRHHVRTTLTDVLSAAFPVACRLVDERFFGYAADRFIATTPPTSPCLHEYGEAFPEFLASFPPCRPLVYLPDVARLEWAMVRAGHADDAAPLDPRALAALPAAERHRLRFAFHPSVTLLASPWPVERIWRANQPDADSIAAIDVGTGGAQLEIRRHGDAVVFRALGDGVYTLRRALHAGRTLGAAADAALAREAGLDLGAALADLFHDETLVAFTLNPCTEDDGCTPRP